MVKNTPVVRLRPRFYEILRKRSKAEGKPIARLIEEAMDRPSETVRVDDLLEYIADLIDERYIAQRMKHQDEIEWVPIEDVKKEIDARRKAKPKKNHA